MAAFLLEVSRDLIVNFTLLSKLPLRAPAPTHNTTLTRCDADRRSCVSLSEAHPKPPGEAVKSRKVKSWQLDRDAAVLSHFDGDYRLAMTKSN